MKWKRSIFEATITIDHPSIAIIIKHKPGKIGEN
jgi:hypothetical protein